MWSLDIEKKMLELVREKEHIWDLRNELYRKKTNLRKSSFDEIAATLQDLSFNARSGPALKNRINK
ncbi:hypothetical protein E2C01_080262 [Portunus trituberculatus]|uniref:MADF domain-containing protein n=1 Tax=Portunus trituberculatus TaxID=210409 RepID=A0A5B7IZ36_PORTR|nr:hypothetical protein [Portunus trituberculatus]